ncbi:MAG: tetratricopeptide repeat protein [Candidatus Saccharimonadales bacterium]
MATSQTGLPSSAEIGLKPRFARAYISRAFTWESKDNLPAAIRDYTEAIRLDPKNPSAFNNRGIARAAIGLASGYSFGYYSLGLAQEALGNADAAMTAYGKAIDGSAPHA